MPENYFDTASRAREIRKQMLRVAKYIPDEAADEHIDFFPVWQSHVEIESPESAPNSITTEDNRYFKPVDYTVGDRVRWGENIYKCLQSHTSQVDWTPTEAVSLWAKVLTEPGKVLPWEQPSAENAYGIGDRVEHNGKIYESTHPANVWEPGIPGTESVWKEVTE